VKADGHRVQLDLTPQVLNVSIPGEYPFEKGEVHLQPTCPVPSDGFVSASLLSVKAKLFDDGLYAAVELAAQEGAGRFAGKAQLLKGLIRHAPSLAAAASLGGFSVDLDAEAERIRREFLADELKSKPLGFYTTSEELRRIFQQDRLLQQELPETAAAAVALALKTDRTAGETYSAYLDLIARLTNPLVVDKPDLRREGGRYFFPPSRSHEADLIQRLYGSTPIPEGFSLAEEMIRRIRAGALSLEPKAESGWYDWQTWALEPLVVPEKTPEAPRLRMDDRYRRHLEDLFKAIIALTRETHVKQLEPSVTGRAPLGQREVVVIVRPGLTVEPLRTCYERRAAGYEFVRGLLESAFGSEALRSMHRVTSSGTVETSLDEQLTEVTALFRGAAGVVGRELGMEVADRTADERFRAWSGRPDPDVGGDIRMMVPIFHDVGRGRTKVWAVLGWSARDVKVAFWSMPVVTSTARGVRVQFSAERHEMPYPVLAETYVSRLMDRDEFRKHCDRYRTRSEILAHL
jgi:hypothetical protein